MWGLGLPAVATQGPRDLGSPEAPVGRSPGPYLAAGSLLFARVTFSQSRIQRNRPPKGGPVPSFIEPLRTGTYPLIFRVADLAFRQTSTPVLSETFGARARYVPGLLLTFFE